MWEMILSKLFNEPSMTISADYKNKNTKPIPNMFLHSYSYSVTVFGLYKLFKTLKD